MKTPEELREITKIVRIAKIGAEILRIDDLILKHANQGHKRVRLYPIHDDIMTLREIKDHYSDFYVRSNRPADKSFVIDWHRTPPPEPPTAVSSRVICEDKPTLIDKLIKRWFS